MSQFATQQPRVTIVMIARERHALTEATLEGLVANTPGPYRLIYTDGQTPEWLWQHLEQRSLEWDLELVRYNEPLWPQELRNRVLDSITTDYVVFIDNDVQVSPNWLEKLVACADETNAGIVGPLYLWGDGQDKPKIHTYTGSLTHINTPQGMVMTEHHDLMNADPDAVAGQLVRKPCDFVEFHCMLLRTGALKKMGGFDPVILNVHEHIDTALCMKQQGYTIYTEPGAQINFLAYAPYVLDDLPVHRWRWAATPAETSIQAFCAKWQVLDHPLAFDGIRNYVHKLTTTVDPIRPAAMVWPDRNTPMQRQELAQTRSDLLDQATARSYAAEEIGLLTKAYDLAQSLTDGGYHPCGRLFINHLVGTTSVLVRYGFKIEIILAGMLHTLYSHSPGHAHGAQVADVVATLMGVKDSTVKSMVQAYAWRGKNFDTLLAIPTSRLMMRDAELIVLAVANEIDLRLSGEIRYSGKVGTLPEIFDTLLAHVSQVLGVGGLTQTFDACKTLAAVAPELLTKIPVNYSKLADKRHMVQNLPTHVTEMICIVATARSGTNALRSLLRQESWIACLDEVLESTLQREIPGNITDFMDRMLRLMPDWKMNSTTAEVLVENYLTYLQSLAVDKIPLIDIKNEQLLYILNWPGDNSGKPCILRQIMEKDYPILRVVRHNWLAQYASEELARQTQEWVRKNSAVIKDQLTKVYLDPSRLLNMLAYYANRDQQEHLWLSDYPRTAWLYYETLFDGSRLSSSARTEIERVIGRSLDPTLSVGTQKIAPPLEQLIDNYAEIQALLKGTPYEEFLEDSN